MMNIYFKGIGIVTVLMLFLTACANPTLVSARRMLNRDEIKAGSTYRYRIVLGGIALERYNLLDEPVKKTTKE